jgi:RecA-family ATPase
VTAVHGRIDDRDELLERVSLRDLLTERGNEPRGSELRCPMPDHEDVAPSASYTPARNGNPELWDCHVCEVGGTVIDLLIHADGLTTARAFEELRRVAGSETPKPTRSPRKSAKPAAAAKVLPSEETIAEWATSLMNNPAQQARLTELRGWSPDVMQRFGLGMHDPDRKSCSHGDLRVSIPVRGGDGRLVGLVCYQPNPARRTDKNKKTRATGERNLFPAPEVIEQSEQWMLLCEGEPDGLCGLSLGLLCVGAPGVGKWRKEWEARFAGRRVLVVPHADQEGRAWGTRTAACLVESAAEVRIAELAPSRDDGYDLTDWVADQRDAWAGDPAALGASVLALAGSAQRVGMDAPVDPVSRLVIRQASTLSARSTEWIWDQRIPIGNLTGLAGRQGTAKSIFTCELAARFTRGELPGDCHGQPGNVVMVSYEDDPEATIRPRLEAAGADLERLFLIDGSGANGERVSLPSDSVVLVEVAKQQSAKLLVIDPIGAALAGDINSHMEADVRAALSPLAGLAAREEISVLLVMHRRKGYDEEPLDSVMGSGGFTGAPRSVLLWGNDPDDPEGVRGAHRVLAHAKSNLAPHQPSLRYRLQGVTLDGRDATIKTARVLADGESPHDAAALTRASRARRGEPVEDACAFLQEVLKDGPRSSKDVEKQANLEGIKQATLRRARERLGVVSRKAAEFQGAWTMSLPEHAIASELF